MDHIWPGFLCATTATTSSSIGFLDFLQPTIAAFDTTMPPEWTCVEHIFKVFELDQLQKILDPDLGIDDDTTHSLDHGPVIALQAMQVRWVWDPGFTSMEHGAPDTWIVDS